MSFRQGLHVPSQQFRISSIPPSSALLKKPRMRPLEIANVSFLTLSSRYRRRIEGPVLSLSKGRSLDTARKRAYSG